MKRLKLSKTAGLSLLPDKKEALLTSLQWVNRLHTLLLSVNLLNTTKVSKLVEWWGMHVRDSMVSMQRQVFPIRS
jgi:hypothetical protein